MSKTQQYNQILNGYYGANTGYQSKRQRRAKAFMSTVFDNGEVLIQKPVTEGGPNAFEEYLVFANSMEKPLDENAANEEYIVFQASHEPAYDMAPNQEYVVGESLSSEDHISNMFSESDVNFKDEIANLNTQNRNREMESLQNNSNSGTNASNNTLLNSNSANNTNAPSASPNYTSNSPSENAALNSTGTPPSQATFPAHPGETQRSMSEDEDLISAMQSILSGEKSYDENSKQLVNKNQFSKQKEEEEIELPKSREHQIFDKIAQSMSYANAYDLGDIDIENKFSEFDYIHSLETKAPEIKPENKISKSKSVEENNGVSKDFDIDNFKAIDEILTSEKSVAPAVESTNPEPAIQMDTPAENPPRPTNIRPYTEAEKQAQFGTFTYEPDPASFGGDGIRVTNNWANENIISVAIPQLNGKLFYGKAITSGTINFHRAGATLLQQLWQAWEQAGLLNKIITFQGGYAARFIRGSQNRNPRPLSNHAYGTAFDINAEWNGFGAEPALAGAHGSVRELVQIANQHGFFWGGHFNRKDGMHFELGHQN
ncbi:MAG: M15 family metallopeptidase [Bacteroidetes bacterium]|nr:M15 family metallopeptidase [Bacteroidota bacterium]